MGHFNSLNLYYFFYMSFTYTLANKSGSLLYCTMCSSTIGDTAQIFNYISPVAVNVVNANIFGMNITTQTVVNPFKAHFDIITVKKVSCAVIGTKIHGHDTWFPGYSWRICVCPYCNEQLGWNFVREATTITKDTNKMKSFHAVMVKSLTSVFKKDRGLTRMPYINRIVAYAKFLKTNRLRTSNDTTSSANRTQDFVISTSVNTSSNATVHKTDTI